MLNELPNTNHYTNLGSPSTRATHNPFMWKKGQEFHQHKRVVQLHNHHLRLLKLIMIEKEMKIKLSFAESNIFQPICL